MRCVNALFMYLLKKKKRIQTLCNSSLSCSINKQDLLSDQEESISLSSLGYKIQFHAKYVSRLVRFVNQYECELYYAILHGMSLK